MFAEIFDGIGQAINLLFRFYCGLALVLGNRSYLKDMSTLGRVCTVICAAALLALFFAAAAGGGYAKWFTVFVGLQAIGWWLIDASILKDQGRFTDS